MVSTKTMRTEGMIFLADDKDYADILKNEGLKSTKHRKAILFFLEQAEQPLTAEELYVELKEKSDSINLSTVYRTLDLFVSKELVNKLTLEDGKARYELNQCEHRHHLFCVCCHKVIAIEDCPMGELQEMLKQKMDFDVTGHKLEIYGYCRNCRTS